MCENRTFIWVSNPNFCNSVNKVSSINNNIQNEFRNSTRTAQAIKIHEMMLEQNILNYNDKLIRNYDDKIKKRQNLMISMFQNNEKSAIDTCILKTNKNSLSQLNSKNYNQDVDKNQSRRYHTNNYVINHKKEDKRMGKRDYSKHESLLNEIRLLLNDKHEKLKQKT